MSIRQQVQWQSGHFEGYVDTGTGTEGDCLPQAKAAFVIMVVAINGHWKVPLGYFLVDKIVVESSTQREEWFKEYVSKLPTPQGHEDEDESAREREKQERIEASLPEREKEVQRTLSTHLPAVQKKDKYRDLLDETPSITLSSTWKRVKKVIREDPRYAKFSSSERKCEKEFKKYLKDKMAAAKSDFRELLKETKTITYKSKKQIEESEQHLLDIQKVLEKDKRYLVLGCIPDERRKLLMAYIEDLDRRGPPPPPTASEPTRRSK
ncbi:hypothetical protein MRX96_006739 [Rhipicephalus microplus]